jgi:hypothetical protein
MFTVLLASGVSARPKKANPETTQPAPPPEAQQRFQRALDLYEEGNLDAARTELQRAYEIAPNWRLLFNLGQVTYELHDYPAALAAFEKYLSEGGAKVPEARRTQVEGDIQKLKARVARLEVASDVPKADVFVDDVAVGSTPLASPLVVSAGRRKITVAKNGYATVTRFVDLAGGDSSQVNVELNDPARSSPPPAPPAPSAADSARAPAPSPTADLRVASSPSPRDGSRMPGVLWGGWALAGSLAIAAGVTGTIAYNSSRELADLRDRRGASRADLDRKSGEVRDLALVTDLVGGAAVLAGGITLVATLLRSSPPPNAETARVRIVPSIGRVDIAGSF